MSLETPRSRNIEKDQSKEPVRSYTLESGVTVEIASRIFKPENVESPERAVVFLPGWAMAADAKSIERLCETFASEYSADTHALTTRSQERGGPDEHPDLLYEEARAVKQYIQERGLKNVILSGHSQGADKAIDLATLIQNDPDFNLDGIVLIDAVGLYEQGGVELAAKFAKNSGIDTTTSVARSLVTPSLKGTPRIGPALRAGNEVTAGIAKEAWRSKTDYWSRFKSEVSEMARKNPHTHEVEVPVVIVSGMSDNVSDVERIIPKNEIDSLKKELGGVTPQEATEENPARDTTLAAREKFLRDTLFPESPYVRMLAPEKLGVHALPILRPESVARTSLYMIERFKRQQRPEEK